MSHTHQTLGSFLWRARSLFPEKEVVSRTADGVERYTYDEYADRTARLANALSAAGVGEGDRVATFCWNHHRHFEAYFGVPNMGAQLHTINPLLPAHHVQHIVSDAEDAVILVDPSLLEPLEAAADHEAFDAVGRFVVAGSEVPETSLEPVVDYESFVAEHDADYDWPEIDDEQPAGMCYTSGTTGKPKGIEYSQRMLWSHTMATLTPQGLGIEETDVVMPVVPMFHVNAWGLPYSTTAAGAKHVYPGPSPTPEDLVTLIEEEGVTLTAGVPTVWLGVLDYLQEHDADLSSLDQIVIGGSAAPESVVRTFDEEYDVDVLHAWGMTETSPIGTVSHLTGEVRERPIDEQYEKRVKQGLIVPGLEFRVIGDDGQEIEWDGEAFGELLIRGPWVATEYFGRPEATREDFENGWLRTGDIVTVDEDGYLQIVDRAKDVIKSGGEWISSVELENALMAHDGVAEATVIGVPHERWQERPVAFIVPASGASGGRERPEGDDRVPAGDADEATLGDELRELIAEAYPKWWVPDDFLTIEEVPKTATGKFDKKVLRDEYDDPDLVAGKAPEDAAPGE